MGVHRLRRQRCHQSLGDRLLFGRQTRDLVSAGGDRCLGGDVARWGGRSLSSQSAHSFMQRSQPVYFVSQPYLRSAQLEFDLAGAALQRG